MLELAAGSWTVLPSSQSSVNPSSGLTSSTRPTCRRPALETVNRWLLMSHRAIHRRDCRGDIGEAAKEDCLVIAARTKSAPAPKGGRLVVDSANNERPPSDQTSGRETSPERMREEREAQAAPRPIEVGRKLPKQESGHRIRRLPPAQRPRHRRRQHRRRRQGIKTYDAVLLMDDHNHGKTLALIGKRAGL